MLNLSYKGRVFWFYPLCFFLYCSLVQSESASLTEDPEASSSNPYQSASSTYLAQAKQQDGEDKQTLLLKAAGRMLADGQWSQSMAILAQTRGLTEIQRNEKEILLARAYMFQDKPKVALDHIKLIQSVKMLSSYHQIEYHRLLADVYRVTDKPLASLSERIQLDTLFASEADKTENQRQIWMTLMTIPQQELEVLAKELSADSETKGWLQLALISRQFRHNNQSLIAALDQWQTQHSTHSANRILPYPLDSVVNKMISEPKQIALLLPLSGPFAGPGRSIQEGLMAAHKLNPNAEAIKIKVYDTAKGTINELYQKAVADGAEFIIGPLLKKQVAAIAAIPHPVPTLLLNESDVELQENSYVFGLSPTSEASQVALKASNRGLHHALIIAPKNDWGRGVVAAFTRQWEEKGGQVSDTLFFGEKEDLNQKIKDFLQLTQSAEREKKLKQFLGYDIESFPSRRQDVDMVFLLAYPTQARQIVPLLKYYYANDIPVYATSSVYSGNANALKDKDLDGIFFCDIPWVFSHQMGARNWPEQFNSHNRLYALGKNSYDLATQLNQLFLFPADGNKEDGGILFLRPNQQVARVFEWGQFKQGLAHSLGETA